MYANNYRKLILEKFDNNQQFIDFINALENRIIPLKFGYVGHAAYGHDALVRSYEYGIVDTEEQLILNQFDSSIWPYIEKVGLNVIDVGSGNGMKGLLILEMLQQKIQNIGYIGLDYSKELLRIATKNIIGKLPNLKLETYQIDFEVGPFPEIIDMIYARLQNPNLFLFLGQTLGNPINRQKTLSNIRNSMRFEDHLLVGVELYQKSRIAEILTHYQNEAFYQAVFHYVTYFGFRREDCSLKISFNDLTRNVEAHLELKDDVFFRIGFSKIIKFKRGEELLIFQSHRFEMMELQEIFSLAQLNILKTLTSRENTYSLIIAKAA